MLVKDSQAHGGEWLPRGQARGCGWARGQCTSFAVLASSWKQRCSSFRSPPHRMARQPFLSFQRDSNDLHSHIHCPSLLPIRPIPYDSARDSPLTLISADPHGISVFSTPQAAFLLFPSEGAFWPPSSAGKTLQNFPERCFSPSFLPTSPLHLTTYAPLPAPWVL